MRTTVWPLLRILSIAHLRADWLPLSLSIATATKGFPPSFFSVLPLPSHISLGLSLFQLSSFQENKHNPEFTNSLNHQLPTNATFSLSGISTKYTCPSFFSHFLVSQRDKEATHISFSILFSFFLFVLQFLCFLSNKEKRTTPHHTHLSLN